MYVIHQHSGASRSPTYNSWQAMKGRCDYPSQSKYHNYGGKGISYCERWKVFANFLQDMGERPEGKTLGRIDGTLGYFKENCRWETTWEQSTNKRPKSSNLSKTTGVCYKKTLKRWIARIQVEGREVYLGCFKTEDEAAQARIDAEYEFWGRLPIGCDGPTLIETGNPARAPEIGPPCHAPAPSDTSPTPDAQTAPRPSPTAD